MDVMSWNMGYWKPSHYRTIENRRRQWALVAALSPDVALLQECRPEDLAALAPGWLADMYDVVGAIPDRWTACSAILARKELGAAPIDPARLPEENRRWLAYLSGYVAAAELVVGDERVSVASVHAIAKEIVDPAVTDADHERLRREALERAWHNDLAAAALTPWLAERFVVGGDWNNALLFDTNYPGGAEGGVGGSAAFFGGRSAAGWEDSMRRFHTEEVRTYLDPSSDAYELDRIFTDPVLHDGLVACRVHDDELVRGLSDHAPLIASFTL